ncbi:restriction endonuclease subunit S [Pseudomonas benzopyrenica]|uniref:restriction endonuclease subunit S n=1 Tax=Pseudomonas benzopyrenica TaxID=2993566 RepID=UPI0039C422EA
MSTSQILFTEVVHDVSGGNSKIPQSEYLSSGSVPVIDQGKGFIAGYTNNEAYLFRSASLPVIVFGDHTRAIKYIDFPFAMGADGVKVLKPTEGCDPKFIYHFLRQTHLPNAGYSRHYKFVKELRFVLPSLPEQRRIAAILDKADALRAKRRKAIAKLDQLLQSVFLEMFGDPVSNSKGWPLHNLAEATFFQEGPGILAKDFRESGVPLVRMAGMSDGKVSLNGCNFVDQAMFERKWSQFALSEGDILVLTSATFGKPAVVSKETVGSIFYTGIIRFKATHQSLSAEFLKSFLASPWFLRQAQRLASGAVIKHFGPTHLKQMHIPIPPMELQLAFAKLTEQIMHQRTTLWRSFENMEKLFRSLQHHGFEGTL